jgi:hypothetical protein
MKSGKTESELRVDHASDALNQAIMALSDRQYAEAARRADEALLILNQIVKDKKV